MGRDLERYIFEEGKDGLGVDRTLALLKPIGEALDYAHSRDKLLIHWDLKPGNVFITKDDEIKLLDFGLAYQLRNSSSGEYPGCRFDRHGGIHATGGIRQGKETRAGLGHLCPGMHRF